MIGNQYQQWNGKRVLLGCGTGRGKTTFALGIYGKWLLEHNKKVLYLCNRKKLTQQIENTVKSYDVQDITIITYQKLKEMIYGNEPIEYDIILCDEAHYFLSDADFNVYTDVVYEYLLNTNFETVVYMTATYWNIKSKLENDLAKMGKDELIFRKLDTDYSYVSKVFWYQKAPDLYGIIDRILATTDDKIVYFANSGNKMMELYKHYDPSSGNGCNKELLQKSKLQFMDFFCSEGTANAWLKKHCNSEALVEQPDGSYTFNNRILITTKVIDNGIDFKDKSIKHIICDVLDIESAIQCLGRKRVVDETDTCIFYIRDWQSYNMNIFYQKAEDELKEPLLFETDRKEWERKYGNDREKVHKTVFFDFNGINDYRINVLRYEKLKSDKELLKKMKKKLVSYRGIITSKLGSEMYLKSHNATDIQADIIKSDMEIWLEEHENTILSKEEQSALVDLCKLKDGRGRQQKSVKIISAYIEENFKPYTLTSERISENGHRSRKWILRKNQKRRKQ